MKWERLTDIPFDSTRKRMSVIVREEGTGKILMLTKGADSVIIPLLTKGTDTSSLQMSLDDFAVEGLRTLVLAQRYVDEEVFRKWKKKWESLQHLGSDEHKEY